MIGNQSSISPKYELRKLHLKNKTIKKFKYFRNFNLENGIFRKLNIFEVFNTILPN